MKFWFLVFFISFNFFFFFLEWGSRCVLWIWSHISDVMNFVYDSFFFYFRKRVVYFCSFGFRGGFFFGGGGDLWSYILHLVPCRWSGCCFRHTHTRPSARHCHRSFPSRTVHTSCGRPSHLYGKPGSWDTRSAPHSSPCHRRTCR